MLTPDKAVIVAQTKKWITDVVIGCGFCPFAAKEMKRGSIHYEILLNANTETVLKALITSLNQLDHDNSIETSLLILPGSFTSFNEYLQLIDLAERLLAKEHYEGIYQIASFHPEYLFAGTDAKDPANYTNRSPYPMLHFLREDTVSKAVDNYPGIDEVPYRNTRFANERGLHYMQQLLAACINSPV